jgi:hypothetical protein
VPQRGDLIAVAEAFMFPSLSLLSLCLSVSPLHKNAHELQATIVFFFSSVLFLQQSFISSFSCNGVA